jgi:tetratricopeptide (TPR) repeat protein
LGHKNANIQLIRIALKRRNGEEAAKRLANLPSLDPGVAFPLGVAFAEAGEFARAEDLFTRALAESPDDFNILVNLGTVAASAGHAARAREAFDAALRRQPGNVDVLVRAARVDLAMKQPEAALRRLAPAAKADRADVQQLIALAAGDLGALDDSLAAWDRYVKLAPGDDTGRRERGFTAVRMGQVEPGVADLRWFLAKHPNDPVAHFQLGVAEQDAARLDRAIALQPDFAAALSARGGLLYQQGKPESAVKDLEAAAKLAPDDPLTLDRLGQTYSALERPMDAVRVLRRAAGLSPSDAKVALHLARALADAGLEDESRAAMERFRQLGPATKGGVPPGLVEYLALSPERQKADYRARVEKAYRESPDDPAAQIHYLKLLLEGGKDVTELARRLRASNDLRLWGLATQVLEGEALRIAELHLSADPMAVAARGPKTVEFLWHAASVLGQRALPLMDGDTREILLLKAALRGSEELAGKIRRQWPEWTAARRPFAELLARPPREW